MRPRQLLAEVDGRDYQPGGAAEIDELLDLFGIWADQREAEKQTGTGYSANMMDDDDA